VLAGNRNGTHVIELSKHDKQVLQGLKIYRIVAIILIFVGIGGIGIGLYSICFRQMSPDSFQIVITLILYSIGYVALGGLLCKINRLLKKLKNILNR